MKRVVRLLVVLLPLALLAGTVPASANDETGYLALGDSVAFGFNPLVSPFNAANFVGYPEVLSEVVVNASCPGETSSSLISIANPDNGCQRFRSIAPLHVAYTGAQLAFAVAYLQSHANTGLVTIDIGANDLFLLQRSCAGAADAAACVATGLPAVVQAVATNLGTIYAAIRGAGYGGAIVALTYYVLNYNDPAQVAAIGAINSAVAGATTQAGGRVASGFAAFQEEAVDAGGSSCTAGLLIALPTGSCDIHPSETGRELLAEAIEDLN